MTTTEFEEFLNNIDVKDIEEMYNLYSSVQEVTQMGSYDCSEKKGHYFVTSDEFDLTLMLTEKSRDYFLKKIDKDYGGDLGIEGEYDFYRNMQKD